MTIPATGPTAPKTDVEAPLGARATIAPFGVPATDRYVDTDRTTRAAAGTAANMPTPKVPTKDVDGTDAVLGPNGPNRLGTENTRGQQKYTDERYKSRG